MADILAETIKPLDDGKPTSSVWIVGEAPGADESSYHR